MCGFTKPQRTVTLVGLGHWIRCLIADQLLHWDFHSLTQHGFCSRSAIIIRQLSPEISVEVVSYHPPFLSSYLQLAISLRSDVFTCPCDVFISRVSSLSLPLDVTLKYS